MNFSELFKQTSQLCKFSPNGQYLASVVQYRLIIRDVQTLQIEQLYTCLDPIQYIEWSSDAQFILCGMYKRGLVQVWSLEEPDWTCKIDEGSAGLSEVSWSPDGRHILTTADFKLRITVWSLLNKSVSYIKYPKACQKGLDFSNDGKYMALAERRDCKDHVSIFACTTWELMKHFETDTDDLAGLKWSPDGRVLGVWESVLNYKVVIYSLDGRCLATYSAYEHALGIKSLQWSPTSQFLAIGSFDQKVRLLNHITWKTVSVNDHPTTIEGGCNVTVYQERERGATIPTHELTTPAAAALFVTKSKYEIQSCPALVPVVKPDLNKANPKIGVSLVSFSPDSRYMFTKNDSMPNCLWLWDIQHLSLAVVLIQASVIKCVEWDPRQSRLALCTATNKLYMWSPSGCLAVDVPAEASFQVHSLRWHPDGDAILLLSKDQMCVCFLASTTTQEPS